MVYEGLNVCEIFEYSDPDYGERFACLRSEFEESPDGFHVVRPLWSISDHEKNQTENLFKREINRIAKLLNIPINKYTQKEIYKVLKKWYKLNYDFNSLEKSIKEGYFKSIEDIENFCLILDDSYSEIVINHLETELTEKQSRNISLAEETEEINYEYQEEDILDKTFIEKLLEISEKIKDTEYSILQNLANANENDKSYWKSQLKKLAQLKEEFLLEANLTYDDIILLWYEMQHARNSGYVKYPIYTVFNQNNFEDEEYRELHEIIDRMKYVKERIRHVEECLQSPEDNDIDPEEITEYHKELDSLKSELKTLEINYRKVLKKIDPEYEIIEKINRLLNEIKYAKNGRIAYKKSEMAKSFISRIKDKVRRYAYYRVLDRTWKERKGMI